MELTPQNKAKIDSLKNAGYSTEEILAYFGAAKYGEESIIHKEEKARAKIADEVAQREATIGDYATKFTDAIGLSGSVETLGTIFARQGIGTDVDKEIVRKYEDPATAKEIAGTVLQLGSTAAGFAITGGSSLLGQIGVGAGLGYLYDVGSDTIDNKSLAEVATPGAATLVGGVAPVALRGLGAAASTLSRGTTQRVAGEAAENAIDIATPNIKEFVGDTPGGAAERASQFIKRFPRAIRHVKSYVDDGAEIAARKNSGNVAVINALDEGIDVRTIDFVENFDDVTKRKAIEMLDLADAPRGSLEPQSVPANIASDQFSLVEAKRKQIGEQIGSLSRELGDTEHDMLPSLRSLRIMLTDNGINAYKGNVVRTTANSDLTEEQLGIVTKLYKEATKYEKLTATQIHKRDQLFSKLQRQARMEGLDDVYVTVKGTDGNKYEVNIFKAFRNVFNNKLNTIDGGKFRKINSEYAFYRNLQDDLEDTLFKGAKDANLTIDPADTAANSLRRLFSNAQSQPRFQAAYDALDATSRSLGYDGARADVLYDFYLTDMKPLYGETVRPASFEGGIRGALSDVVSKVADLGKSTEADKRAALRGLLEPESIDLYSVGADATAKTAKEAAEELVKETAGKATPSTNLLEEAGSSTMVDFVQKQTDPLYEYKKGMGIRDDLVARASAEEAIADIGGIDNVHRGNLSIDKLNTTENINTNSQRYANVLDEVQSGERTPIIVDEQGFVVDGHHRLKAYEEIGLTEVPVVAPKTFDVNAKTRSQLEDIWKQANQ